MEEDSQPHLLMVPSPGLGHLIPLLVFAKRLAAVHRFSVIVAIPSDTPPSKHHLSVVANLPSAVKPLFLPLVSFLDLPKHSKSETLISLAVTRSLPFLRRRCHSLAAETRLAALVADHFAAAAAFDVAAEFNLPRFLFFPPSAMSLSFALHLPDLDRIVAGEFRDHPDPIRIPGCSPIHGRELLNPVQDREDDAYKLLLSNYERFKLADGIFVNSFPELEPETVKSLIQQQPPVYPIGPIVRTKFDEIEEKRAGCLNWLDEQPNGSVLFVSFGSGDTLSSDEIKELAMGLELSEQRFVWVVKTPIDKSEGEDSASELLPEGFEKRVKNRGMVVQDWAPQIGVLSHIATGGFLSHCGWNSIMESVVSGVPMIAWPLWGEQRMNAHLITEDLKVALRMKKMEKEEIAEMVKSLMEGEDGKMIREKMKNLKVAAQRNLEEDGCSSNEAILKWKNTIIND